MSELTSIRRPDDHNDIEPQAGVDSPGTNAAKCNLEVAKANLDLVIHWVSHADSKATFYLTIALAILGASLTEIPSLVRVCQYFFSTSCWWVPATLIATHLAFYGSVFFSAHKSIEVVKPRLSPASKTHSWYFFQSVAAFEDVEKWRDFTYGLKDTDRLQQLVDQIWNVSRVAVVKYKAAGTADFALRIACCFGTVSVLITLVLDAVTRQ